MNPESLKTVFKSNYWVILLSFKAPFFSKEQILTKAEVAPPSSLATSCLLLCVGGGNTIGEGIPVEKGVSSVWEVGNTSMSVQSTPLVVQAEPPMVMTSNDDDHLWSTSRRASSRHDHRWLIQPWSRVSLRPICNLLWNQRGEAKTVRVARQRDICRKVVYDW